MKRFTLLLIMVVLILQASAAIKPFIRGNPGLKSMGTLEFAPDGTLFIGDSRSGAIYAIKLADNNPGNTEKGLGIDDLENQIGAFLGATSDEVLIHDLAVHPISKNAYLSVSRSRANWTNHWQLPNELADPLILIRITPEGKIEEASLDDVEYATASIPNLVDESKEHKWKKGLKLRSDAITDLAFRDNRLYVAGLSNEEFASTMWVIDYPFEDDVSATTLEIYHGAHGEYETHAPIRTFLPYELNKKQHLIAAYLCTPLVTFETSQLKDGQHVKGRTVAEFGAGNYPVDMVAYKNDGKEYILMSNTQLPLMVFDPEEVASFEGEITEEVKGYLAGVKYTPRSGSGIYHLADFDDKFILATQRLANGKLALRSLHKSWMRP